MKLSYNVTGAERKSLVGAISQELNTQIKYLGMPTAAYEVGEYTIDKNGTVTGPDNRELGGNLQSLHNLTAVSEEYDMPDTEAEECPDIDQHHPGQYADPNVPPTETMLRQAAAWMEGQPDFEDLRLTEREELGLGRERRENFQGENGMQASDVPERYTYRAELSDPDAPERMEVFSADDDEDALRRAYEYATGEVVLLELHELDADYNEIRTVDIPRSPDRLALRSASHLVIEMPKDGFTETAIDNLRKLVESKASLIKKAIGTDGLAIEETEETLRFPWFELSDSADEVGAYTKFISALCEMAKEQKRITAKEKPVDNEKYAFRCFLLRLGFIGDDYKAERKILLANLSGNGSFKSGERRLETDAANIDSAPDSLAEALADAELIHAVNISFESESAGGGNIE